MKHRFLYSIRHISSFSPAVLRFCVFILATNLLILTCLFLNSARFKTAKTNTQLVMSLLNLSKQFQSSKRAPVGCFSPILSLNTSHINHFFTPSTPFHCTALDWVVADRGAIRLKFENLEKLKISPANVDCNYLPFVRKKDDENEYLTNRAVSFRSSVKMVTDFAKIECVDSASSGQYSNVHASIVKKAVVGRKQLEDKVSESWNVLYIGFDSTSRLTFQRKFPLSFQYLTETLGAIILKRYNIVGDGTPQALIPLFTGRTEQELPDVRKSSRGSFSADVYPNIWRNFSQSGYATLYAEDYAIVGMFADRLNGFENQPTDHYLRNYYFEERKQRRHTGNALIDRYCIGEQKEIELHLKYSEQFFEAYPDMPKFGFVYSDIGHDDNNLLDIADRPLYHHLKYLKETGKLDQTILIVFGDHGARYSHIRQTQDGKMEERNPIFSFVLPEAFRRKHPQAAANLKKNEERLCTPFDAYETVLSVINGIDTKPGSTQERGISLFREIPLNRTCADTHIEPHWCTCLNWVDVTPDDAVNILQIIQDYLNNFNKLTEAHRALCTPIELNSTRFANKLMPDEGLMNYEWVKDADGYVPRNKKGYSKLSSIVYTVTFDTKPGGNVYECSATYDLVSKTIQIDMLTVSVLNFYSRNGHCVHDIDYTAERYCYCHHGSRQIG